MAIYEVIFKNIPPQDINAKAYGVIGWTTRGGKDIAITDHQWSVEFLIEDYGENIEDINIITPL